MAKAKALKKTLIVLPSPDQMEVMKLLRRRGKRLSYLAWRYSCPPIMVWRICAGLTPVATSPRGEAKRPRTLTPEEKAEVKRLRATTSMRDLALRFDCSVPTIRRVCNGVTRVGKSGKPRAGEAGTA